MKSKLALLIFLAVFGAFATSQAKPLHLFAAASMTDAIKEIMTAFTAAYPKVEILPNFASSGSLAKQIAHGAPADIYISANPKWMEYLVDNQLIAPGSATIFAHNQLVFVTAYADRLENGSLDALLTLERVAIGDPRSVPAGRYAQQAMERGGVYQQLRAERKFIFAKDVRQALLYADRGEVDGAFVYKTDALLARNAKVAFQVPDDLYDRVSYPVGITATAAKNELATAFYHFIRGDKAAAILSRYGFKPVSKQ